jgi:hypothetical protein
VSGQVMQLVQGEEGIDSIILCTLQVMQLVQGEEGIDSIILCTLQVMQLVQGEEGTINTLTMQLVQGEEGTDSIILCTLLYYAARAGGGRYYQHTHYTLAMHSLCTRYALAMHSLYTHYAVTMLYTHYALTVLLYASLHDTAKDHILTIHCTHHTGFFYPSKEVSHTFVLHSIYDTPIAQRTYRELLTARRTRSRALALLGKCIECSVVDEGTGAAW